MSIVNFILVSQRAALQINVIKDMIQFVIVSFHEARQFFISYFLDGAHVSYFKHGHGQLY